MGDALDEEKERRQQLAGVRPCLRLCCRWCSFHCWFHHCCHLADACCGVEGYAALAAALCCPHFAHMPPLSLCRCVPSLQVRKQAREAIARERDQRLRS